MGIVKVTLTNRLAWITECSDEDYEALREYWSFMPKGAMFDRRYKMWCETKAQAERKALRTGNPVDYSTVMGWDGKVRLFQRGHVPAGLFRATCDAAKTVGIRFKITKDLPDVGRLLRLGFVSDERHSYQNDCIKQMVKSISDGGGIVLSATGCLDGETYIDTPRDLKKYPYGIQIRDLVGKKPWVYCYDQSKKCMNLVQAKNVVQSGTKRPVYRVVFEPIKWAGQDGRRRLVEPLNYLIATGEHPVLLRDGVSYVPLAELKAGDRVMPFFRSLGVRRDYATLNLNSRYRVLEHRFVLARVYGARSKKWHGHHKNSNSYDNSVGNLEWKTTHKHASDHAKERRARGEFLGWEHTGIHPRGMTGKTQTEHHAKRMREVNVASFKVKEETDTEPVAT